MIRIIPNIEIAEKRPLFVLKCGLCCFNWFRDCKSRRRCGRKKNKRPELRASKEM